MAPKKIVLVTNQLKNIRSGVGTVANLLIEQLHAHFEILIICPEGEKIPFRRSNVTLRTVKSWRGDPTNHKWLSFAYESSKILQKLDRKEYCTIVFLDARESLFSGRLSIPTLGIVHDFYSAKFSQFSKENRSFYPDWFQRYIYFSVVKLLEERAYNKLSELVAVCDYTRKQIFANYGVKRKITVIRNGIDLRQFRDVRGTKKEDAILFVGGNFFRKGLPQLIASVDLVAQKRPIKCYVIGTDKYAYKLENKSRYVQFLGSKDYSSVRKYFQKCKVFCMPSLYESYAMVYLEALAQDMQVLASKNSGTPEIRHLFPNLHIVDPLNIEKMAGEIIQSLDHPSPTKGENLQLISSEQMGKEYIALIKRMS